MSHEQPNLFPYITPSANVPLLGYGAGKDYNKKTKSLTLPTLYNSSNIGPLKPNVR